MSIISQYNGGGEWQKIRNRNIRILKEIIINLLTKKQTENEFAK